MSVVTEYLNGWTKAALSSSVLLKEMHNMAFVLLQENEALISHYSELEDFFFK